MCVLPAVAGPGLWGSPAVGVCACYGAAPGGGGELDVRDQEEQLTRRKSSLLTVYRAHVTNDWQVLDCFFYIVILRLIKVFWEFFLFKTEKTVANFLIKAKQIWKIGRNPSITDQRTSQKSLIKGENPLTASVGIVCMRVRLCLTCVYVRWWCVSRLQWIQVKDFISPDVRNELQDWRRRRGGGGGRCLLTLTSVSDGRDRRRAPPAGDDNTRH